MKRNLLNQLKQKHRHGYEEALSSNYCFKHSLRNNMTNNSYSFTQNNLQIIGLIVKVARNHNHIQHIFLTHGCKVPAKP